MKRFTDTELWKKPWFMDLTPTEKLSFFYIKDQCDNVGVWTPNFRLAEFIIGSQLDWDKFAGKCHENILVLENGKWWLIDFCSFQHQDLVKNPDGGNSKALASYVNLLQGHGLYELFLKVANGHREGIERAYQCPQGKGKGTGTGTGTGTGEIKTWYLDHVLLTSDEYDKLVSDYGSERIEEYIGRLDLYLEDNPSKQPGGKHAYKNHNKTIRTWLRNAGVKKESDMPEVII